MMIGGGPTDFVVTLSVGAKNFTLKNRNADEGILKSVCAGGQFGEFSASSCSKIEACLDIIKSFFALTEHTADWVD